MTSHVNPRLNTLLASLSLNLAEEQQRALASTSGLSGTASLALLALGEFLDGTHIGRLAEVMGLTHSGAVRLVAQLERDGLAQRFRPENEADRRQVLVRLTADGRRLEREARAARDTVMDRATDGLTAAESRTLEALLDRVVGTRVAGRVSERRDGDQAAWWCRVCNFTDCGRPEGRCPARNAAAAAPAERASP